MKYKIGDKVKIVKYSNMSRGNSLYLNMTGEIIGNVGELLQLRLNEKRNEIDDCLFGWLNWIFVRDEQLVKIRKGLEIE